MLDKVNAVIVETFTIGIVDFIVWIDVSKA